MDQENAVYSFRVCFEPDGDVRCNKILETDETREMTEAEAISNAGKGTTVDIVDVSLNECESEILESLLTLNHYMDYALEDLLCRLVDSGFKAGMKHGIKIR